MNTSFNSLNKRDYMKTKGEIEVIADKLYGEYAGYHKASFVNGYTQCQ